MACMRARAQARTTPMRVSLARAYTAAGITQMAVSRQPCPAAIAFIARDRPTQRDVQRAWPQRAAAVQR